MTNQPSDARRAAEAILATLEEECARTLAGWHSAVEVEQNAAPEDRDNARNIANRAHGESVGSYWAHDAARRAYRDYFGEWPPNPQNGPSPK